MFVCEHNTRPGSCVTCQQLLRIENGTFDLNDIPHTRPTLRFMRLRYFNYVFRISPQTKRMQRCRKDGEWMTVCGHNRSSTCRSCGFGSNLCPGHGVRRNRCLRCDPGLGCFHHRLPDQCGPCGGSEWCKEYNKNRHLCAHCGGSRVCPSCKTRLIKQDGLCISCNPNFVPSEARTSKLACHVLDTLDLEQDFHIQHRHLDPEGVWTGDEYRLPEWPKKPVDGKWLHPQTGQTCFLEILGDYWHGHPRMWKDDETKSGHGGRLLKDLFAKTQRTLHKLKDLGPYRVFYIWESDYYAWEPPDSLWSRCREFVEVLEY